MKIKSDKYVSALGIALLLSAWSGVARAQVYEQDCNDPDNPLPTWVCHEVPKSLLPPNYPYYVGHDEPLIEFFSKTAGSGNNTRWKIRLPQTDPAPTQNGTRVANRELYPTYWFSMALCDPASTPFGACTPNSDSNTSAAGSAILELQFYPPGSGCSDNSKWCASLTIDELTTNCGEPITAANITTDGTTGGTRFLMSPGDSILITIKDTASGLRTDVNDLTSLTSGFMVASTANKFTQTLETTHMQLSVPPPAGTCSTTPFAYHPEYLTASPANQGSWINDNISFSFEIGHFELCGDAACKTLPDPPDPSNSQDDTGCQTVLGVGGCTGQDSDHDGLSYQTVWPDGNAAHPSTLIIGNALDNGVGPLSFSGGSYQAPYGNIFFQPATVAGAFYPFYSQAGTGASCVFNFGNDIPGTTTNDFGKTAQYGKTIPNPCGGAPPPSISKAFGAATIQLGQSTTLIFTITNPNAAFGLTGVAFTDTLPAGVTVATSSAPVCGGTLTNTFPGTITLSGATIAASGQCQFPVTVIGGTPGIWTNVTSKVTSNESINGNQATATLTVVSPPTISKSFAAPKKIIPGGIIALSFTVGNPNSFAALPGVGFTDTLPTGLVVNTPNGLSGSCGGGTITAAAGSNSISLANATLAASANCSFSVNVTAATDGKYVNTTGPVFSVYGSGGTATDTLFVAKPPSLSKSFGGILTLLPGGTTGLAFTLTNPNSVLTLTGLAFSDTLPAGLLVSTPNGLAGSCDGGTITAIPGTNLVTLTGASLAAGASCTFSVNVTAANFELGLLTNTTSTVTSNEALPGASASANIFVGNPFQVRSASNLPIGDSVINVTDTGTSSTSAFPTQNGNICLNVYTFSPDEQLIACCSCPVTPDGLNSLSARNDLISNTLTPGVPTSIVIKLLASTGAPACNASTVTGANMLATGLAAWGTTIHALPVTPGSPATTYGVTETPFRPSTLSAAELTRITTLCGFIQINGSGFGICKSCRFGGLAGNVQ